MGMAQQIFPRGIGDAALHMGHELGRRHDKGSLELCDQEQETDGERRGGSYDGSSGRHTLRQIVAQYHDDCDRRHVHQKVDVMNQDQHHRRKRCPQHEGDGARRRQQQADRNRAAVDVEMPQRMQEILEKERRTRHQHE